MRKANRVTAALLILSAFGAIGFLVLTQIGKVEPRFQIERVQILPIVSKSSLAIDGMNPDTQVSIMIKDRWPIFARLTAGHIKLVESSPQLLFTYADREEEGRGILNRFTDYNVMDGRMTITYVLSLKERPKTVEKATIRTTITMNETSKLSINTHLK